MYHSVGGFLIGGWVASWPVAIDGGRRAELKLWQVLAGDTRQYIQLER